MTKKEVHILLSFLLNLEQSAFCMGKDIIVFKKNYYFV